MTKSRLPEFLLVVPWEVHHPGGVNQVVIRLYDALLRRDMRSCILIKSWEHSAPAVGVATGRQVVRWRFRDPAPKRNAMKAGVLFWASLPWRLLLLWRWLRSETVGTVNVHYPGLWVLPFAILRRLSMGAPRLGLSLHGQDLRTARAWGGLRAMLWRYILGSADCVVACSEALAVEVRTAFPHVKERVAAVANGFDPPRTGTERLADSTPRALDDWLREGRRYVTCVATFEHKKGQDVLLEAYARLAEQQPNTDLVLAGRETDALPALREQAHMLGIAERVLFLTDLEHDQALAVIRNAALFVLPSRYEPFGIVLLEAGYCGTPVVATAVGGIREIVSDPELGELVPPEDPVALAAAMEQSLADPTSRARKARRLHARVQEVFTWDAACDRYVQLLGVRPPDCDSNSRIRKDRS